MADGVTFAGDGSKDVGNFQCGSTQQPQPKRSAGPVTFTKGNADGSQAYGDTSKSADNVGPVPTSGNPVKFADGAGGQYK